MKFDSRAGCAAADFLIVLLICGVRMWRRRTSAGLATSAAERKGLVATGEPTG